ncbi:isochorismatase family protein [Pseudoroseomonas wenyumeiae]
MEPEAWYGRRLPVQPRSSRGHLARSLCPRPQDRIVLKNKPSCFFATPLEAFLRYDEVDTLIICGISTSGCVRAGATDAFQHNFRTILVEEACGDRSPSAHKANLFDLDMKFADVENLEYVVGELKNRFGNQKAVK